MFRAFSRWIDSLRAPHRKPSLARRGRKRQHVPAIEALETRQLLTDTSLSAISQGIFGQDPVTGEWNSIRYDGSKFVTENADTIDSIGQWSASVAADLDGNGLKEIYIRNTHSGDWWEIDPTTGQTSESWVTFWPTSMQIQKMLVGDVTGDGRDDLVVFDQAGAWSMLSYNGSKFVTTSLSVWGSASQWQLQSLSLVDMNGDGTREILGLNSTTGVWWSLAKSGGVYVSQSLLTWNSTSTYDHFMIGDINGDGRDDIVAQNNQGNWWAVSCLGSTDTSVFLRGWTVSPNWQNWALVDLDGDGWDEVVAQDRATGAWWGILHSSTGYYNQKLMTWSAQNTFSNLLVGDVTGDGRDDLVLLSNWGGWWALSYNGDYQTTSLGSWNATTSWKYISLIDVDGNGVKEVVGWDSSGGNWTGIFKTGSTYVNKNIGFWGTQSGYSDVLFGKFSTQPGESVIGWNNDGGWWLSTLGASGSKNSSLASMEPRVRFDVTSRGDINGDGLQDLIGYDDANGNWWGIVLEASGWHNRFLGHVDPGINWQFVTIADLDGDGRSDIVQWNPANGAWVGFMSKSGFRNPTLLTTWTTGNTYAKFMTGDLDGDGRTDLIAQNNAGMWWAVMSNGSTFRSQRLMGWDPALSWQDVGFADLNGDGKGEIFARSKSTGDWWTLYWDGLTARSQKISNWSVSTQYGNLLVGDVTGDGRPDIVERDMFGNFWALNFNGSTYNTTFLRGWNTNVAWKNFTLVDLNGDGIQDVVGYDTSTGNWWGIFKKSGAYVSQLLINGSQGISATGIAVADLDGNGRQELIGNNTTTKQYWSLSFVNDTPTVQTLATGVNWQRVQVGSIPGTSDAMLRRQILLEKPQLATALANGNTLQAATLILQWTAVAGDFALQGNVLAPLVNTVSEQYYAIFQQNLAGMSCGGYAAFFSGVLQLFGIDSLNIGVGNLPLISHTTVVIPIQESGVWKFYLLDPTFGAAFVNLDTGNTATFFDLVDYLKAGKLNRISTTQLSLDQRDFLSPTAVSSSSVTLKGKNSGNYIYSWPGYGLNSYIQTYVVEMQTSGFQTGLTGFVQLMTNHVYLVQAYGTTSVTAASAFLSELSKRNIVYGS